ncbi:hypothetical protein [Puia dinghuensis]|uniref:APCDD1 domain-containing protein n=1 Tax=Puia dinghuensis TaxID=1792502 RepID=A0A8J2UE37_9BACT|nr:hypothetical protein [Puia dinghuensis]GGB02569.1 hypothetical protein GCM10011511_27310 [Puia dinghuensis]
MNIDKIKQQLVKGDWVSIAPEIRPSTVKTATGDIKPLYCSRRFSYFQADTFRLIFINYADPFGKAPVVEMRIEGHVHYGAEHPIAPGAYEADYVADISFDITILNPAFVAALNAGAPSGGISPWELNVPQSVLSKSVPAFGLKAGEYFTEYDLIYLHENLLFNGSRNIDGRPFDKPANRPTNLQIPLILLA